VRRRQKRNTARRDKPLSGAIINTWAKESADDKLYFFGAVHPDDAHFYSTVEKLKSEGFIGVKMHPITTLLRGREKDDASL
jgi:hypothetical protein